LENILKKIFKLIKNNNLDTNKVEKFQHIHQLSEEYLNKFYLNYEPVFVLNTGRSGSAFMNHLFKDFIGVASYHEAFPNLFLLPNYAFHNQYQNEILKKIIEGSRIELMLQASIENKLFIESNQCLVFFVNQIKQLFPNSKFIHLTRHPGDFVSSAIKKGWHKNDSVWEKGRIKMENEKEWGKLTQIEKLSWVWATTNEFIENFKQKNESSFLTVRLEDIVKSTDEFERVLKFIGLKNQVNKNDLKERLSKKINEVSLTLNEPDNMHKLSSYPNYKNWVDDDKNKLKVFVFGLSQKYNYKL